MERSHLGASTGEAGMGSIRKEGRKEGRKEEEEGKRKRS